MSVSNRSDALIELLADLTESDLRYVLVGGYAVSVFNTRFSTDLDIVVAPEAKDEFVTFLETRGFEQTDSHDKQWYYDTEVVHGGTQTTTARAVDGAVLIAAKLHSGRETDLRDVVAVAEETDLETVTLHLHRGDPTALRTQLERGIELLDNEELKHGFRSDFGASTVAESTITDLRTYLSEQVAHCADK